MMRFLPIWSAAFALAGLAASADDMTELSADDLNGRAVAAVEAENATALLDVMKEMQRRGMHFFEAPGNPLCDRQAPRIESLSRHPAHWGLANAAYFRFNALVAIELGTCECPMALASFEDFTRELLGVSPEDIGEQELVALREFREGPGSDGLNAYWAFERAQCRVP